jgi:hypothetical protein
MLGLLASSGNADGDNSFYRAERALPVETPMTIRKLMTTGAVAALLGIGAVAVTATTADARTVCNRFGDCWHDSNNYTYPGTLGVRFYGDDWRGHHHWNNDRYGHYRWRGDHDGRGYYRNGLWVTF